ncbi:hypothetical protein RO3G_17462 [Lichtheimia corymbifera JMRC:FSU:9682]|uniref:ISXO2-like transposase domain-containing protein n=1 Tax=Lichtheimia corymbifera JMRC:FSU:9682 TaxID=1263082 RepID=A0A068SGE8_9FUNG|nr:hypothetical protein RO3G_17462 [Lichtheimia corymbifera JMRC:FSU:9682]
MKIVEITKNGRPQLVWNCTHAACDACKRQRKSLRDGSFFSGIKIGMHQVLGIVWLYLYKVEMQGISDLTGASAATVRSVIHLLYRLMNADIKDEDVTIGGKDSDGNAIIVEVDESKFGKRKRHRGHRVEGVWVVGGVEKAPERKLFVTTVEDRKNDTLHLILGNYIKAGSEIRTDCWKGYCGLSRLPGKQYRHKTVNHAKEFKTAAGVHTNTIEDEEFMYTEVRRERADLDHDDAEFGGDDGWETESESEDDANDGNYRVVNRKRKQHRN